MSDDGGVALHEALPPSVTASLLGIFREFWEHTRFYDALGAVWRSRPTSSVPKPAALQRILANTVYNPRRSISISYEAVGTYELRDLKAAIAKAVAEDDDVLTQFMDSSEIQERLQQASKFSEVALLIRQMLEGLQSEGHVPGA